MTTTVLIVVVVVVVVVPLVAGLIYLLVRSRSTVAEAPPPTGPAVDPTFTVPLRGAVPGSDPALAAERDLLAGALAHVRTQLDSVALQAWIDEALGAARGPDAGRGRERLVQALVDVRDQVTDPARRASIADALRQVGVTKLVADGQRFDPAAHRALDYVATTDPAYDLVVAQTSRPGYVDRGRLVRAPEVLVYRAGDGR